MGVARVGGPLFALRVTMHTAVSALSPAQVVRGAVST